VDAAPMAFKPPVEAYRIIRREISGFSPTLAGKPEVVVATKIDAVQGKPALAALRKAVKKETGGEVLEISAATGIGLKALLRRLLVELDEPKVEAAGEKMV